MKTLVIGASHVGALARALDQRPDATIKVRYLRASDSDIASDAALLADLSSEYTGLDVLCLCLGGNAHNIFALFNDPVPYYLLPSEPNGMLVPWDMMDEHFALILRAHLKAAEQLGTALPARRTFLINAPPPGADAAHILANPGPFDSKVDLGVSPDAPRRHLYTLQTKVYHAHADAIGAGFLPSPDQCLDERGMLARAFWLDDPTHANAAYGHLVLDLLRREMEAPI